MKEPFETKLLLKDRINTWLENLQDYDIYGPVKRENYSEFSKLTNLGDLNLNLRNTVVSPKNIIFSQTKNMFKYDLKSEPPNINETNDDTIKNQIIIGLRPCDAHGILAFDPTFDAEFKDPYYLNVRKHTVLVGLACNEPDINCFCHSVVGGPFDSSGMDIMLIDLGESYLIKIYTDKGKKITEIKTKTKLFLKPADIELKNSSELKASAESTHTRAITTMGKAEKLGKIFESDYWDDVSRKCLGCGICTFLCPTCYCFDITDEKWGLKGERIRTWDSCMYSEYTVHASGYNPRPARMNRLRNRFYHKFKYYPDLYNMFGCTGCGRCIRHCPVNIDIINIINGVENVNDGGDGQ